MENLKVKLILLLAVICVISCKPLKSDADMNNSQYIANLLDNADITSNILENTSVNKMRTKRSEDNCEKLELCRLHARSRHSFFATFELYFVNRENARLWDHRARSLKECNDRYSCYKK